MMQERLVLQGRLTEVSRKMVQLKMEMKNCIDQVRVQLALSNNPLDLQAGAAKAAMDRLAALWHEGQQLREEKRGLEQALGVEPIG